MTFSTRLLACWLAFALSSSTFAADLEFANGLFREKKYDFAAQEYEAFLREFPNSARSDEARFFLAEAHVQLARTEQAIPLYQKVVDSTPAEDRYHRLAMFRIGQFALETGEPDQSLRIMREFVRIYPRDELLASAHYLLGEAALGTGDDQAATRAFAEALRHNPDESVKANIQYGQAKLAEKQGDVAAALKQYATLAERPELPIADDALLASGALLFQTQQYNEALQAFESLARRFPGSNLLPNAQLNRGLCLYQLGRHNEAVAQLRQLTEQADEPAYAPLAADAWLYLARAFAAREKPDLAIQTLRQAASRIADADRRVQLLTEAAKLQVDAGNPGQAHAELLELAKANPSYSELDHVMYLACSAATAANDLAAAQKAFADLQRQFPASSWRDQAAVLIVRAALDQPDTSLPRSEIENLLSKTTEPAAKQRLQYYLALHDFRQEKFADAFRNASTLLSEAGLDPRLTQDCQYLAGVSLAKQGQHTQAVGYLVKFLQSTSDEVLAGSAARQLGAALTELPDAQAQKLIQDVARGLARQENAAAVLGLLADGLYESGRLEQATAVYRSALDQGPTDGREKLVLGLCWCLIAQEQFEDALKQLQLLDASASPERMYLTGVCQQQLGRSDEALTQFREVMAKADAGDYRVDAALRSANILTAKGNAQEADSLLDQFSGKLTPDQQRRLAYERAWLAFDAQQTERSRELFHTYIERYPETPSTDEAMLKLAEIEFALGNYAASLKLTQDLQSRRPAPSLLPNLYYRQGTAALRLKQSEQAQAAFQSLKQAAAGDPRLESLAQFWLAELAFEGDQAQDAMQKYREILASASAEQYHATAQLRIGELLLRDRQWEEASEAAAKVASLTEDADLIRQAVFVQAKSLQQQAQFDDARRLYGDVLAEQRDELSAKAQFMIAETFLHQREYRSALREYLKVEILYSQPQWQSMALLQIMKCHQALGEPKEAREAYGKLLERFPETEAAKQAAQSIERNTTS